MPQGIVPVSPAWCPSIAQPQPPPQEPQGCRGFSQPALKAGLGTSPAPPMPWKAKLCAGTAGRFRIIPDILLWMTQVSSMGSGGSCSQRCWEGSIGITTWEARERKAEGLSTLPTFKAGDCFLLPFLLLLLKELEKSPLLYAALHARYRLLGDPDTQHWIFQVQCLSGHHPKCQRQPSRLEHCM